jgi:hypothetical protein
MDTDSIGPCREWPGSTTPKGYGRIRWGSSGYIAVHRLVWMAVHGDVPEIDGKPGMILHRCDNPPCFRLDHLYAATHADNMRDRALAGNSSVFGEANGQAKLTETDVREMRELYELGWTQVRIAERFAITQAQVSPIVRRLAWTHVT